MKKNLLVLGACAIFLMTGCFASKKSTSNKNASDIAIKNNVTEGVEVKHYYTNNDEVIFLIKNTSKELIDYISLDIAFYNTKGDLARTEKQYARNLNTGSESIVKVNLKEMTEDGAGELPKKIEIAVNKVVYSSKYETIYTDKVEGKVEKTDTEGQLNLTITNNSGVTLDDLSAAVVFYKGGNPVDLYAVNVSSVEGTHTEIVYVPSVVKNETSSYLDYDEVKVIINNASKYNTEG